MSTICYLCQKPIPLGEYSEDHVPAKQIFPSEYLAKNILTLKKIPAHIICNKSYQKDEDYFFATLAPVIEKVFVAPAVWNDLKRRASRKEARGLTIKVRNEFGTRLPSGICLPGNKVIKRFDGDRVYRVIWKIIRGLFFIEYGQFLTESQNHYDWLWEPQLPQPTEWDQTRQLIINEPSRGNHPGIFDYKYLSREENGLLMHAWGLLFWDKIMFMSLFHDFDCKCLECLEYKNVKTANPSPLEK